MAFDPTPGFSIGNILATQSANATGTQIPGLNTSYSTSPTLDPSMLSTYTQQYDQGKIDLTRYNALRNAMGVGDYNNPYNTAVLGVAGTTTPETTPLLNTQPQTAWTSQNQQLYDASVADINAQRARADRQAQIGIRNVGQQYNQQLAGLNSGRKQATNDYNFGTTTNQQNYTTDSNRINSSAAQGLRGLLRQMGAMGAGGGSAYQYAAPEAAGAYAREQLSGVGMDYAGNERNLDKTYTMFNEQAKEQEKQLNDWRTGQENQVRSQAEQQKQNLLETLRSMAAERAQAMGSNVQAALDPYTGQIAAARTRIDDLARFNPTFTGETPVYAAPELSRFQMENAPGVQFTPGSAQGSNRNYLNVLLGRDEERQR